MSDFLGFSPPVDSTTQVVGYLISYGFVNVGVPGEEAFPIKLYIYDERIKDGKNFENELYFLRDSLYPKLPDAYQFSDGKIRWFAYESQFSSVFGLLAHAGPLWIITRGGRVYLQSGRKTVDKPILGQTPEELPQTANDPAAPSVHTS